MKVALVSMVKNECDIIELFLKINLRQFDHAYIFDHMSTDGTDLIIKKLIHEGYPITYIYHKDVDFRQSDLITSAVNYISKLNIYDYLVPLDADEFLATTDEFRSVKDAISVSLSTSSLGLVPWRTYCPISDSYYAADAPLFEIFRMRKFEPTIFHKVIIGNEFSKSCVVSEGNHFAVNSLLNFNCQEIPIHIQHVPIRSSEQIINKSIMGSHTLSLKKSRQVGEGFHWDNLADIIRTNEFLVDDKLLLDLAISYAAPPGAIIVKEFDDLSPRIGLSDDRIVHRELSKINVIKSFDSYISQCVKNVQNSWN
jgi:hypothetical protein